MTDRGKKSKANEVKPVENISKNLQSFLEISLVQKEVVESFQIKEDNPSQINFQSQLSDPGLSDREQECQESLIQGKIHNQENLNEGLKYLSF